MQCLHLLRRYFVPLPWRFLTQPELQQGSDRLNCNQKYFLIWYAIKINCIYINEQVASILSCNLRSDSELERHLDPAFSVTPARRTLFWRPEISSRWPEISSRWPEILYRLINMYQLKILTSTCVTMSAMPPVDNYISIFFYWKTVTGSRYYNGRGISRPNSEMNCNDIVMRHIFWSTWNAKVIAQSPAITSAPRGRNGGLLGADAEKNGH